MTNKISVLIDVAVDGANRSLGSFKKSIQDADGAAGKFKAGFGAATDSVKANAGALALGAGSALVAFAGKSVAAFQTTALEAGKLRDSLGLTAEEASRMMEVSGDLGIGLGALETSIGKMNLAAAKTPERFAAMGAEIAKNADGTTNVQQTFLNAVDAINAIPDATKRAQAASQVFGKGWREISELIGRGSDELKRNLAEVGEGKVMSDEKVRSAREFRDRLDELGDKVSDVQASLGGKLVPQLIDAADAVLAVSDAVEDLSNNKIVQFLSKITGLTDGLIGGTKAIWEQGAAFRDWIGLTDEIQPDSYDVITDAILRANKETEALTASTKYSMDQMLAASPWIEAAYDDQARAAARERDAVNEIKDAFNNLTEVITDRSAYLDLEDSFDGVREAAVTAADTAGKSLQEQEADARNAERATLDLKQKIIDYATEVGGIPPQKVTELVAMVDRGQVAEVEYILASLERTRYVNVQIKATTVGSTYAPGISAPKPGGWDGDPRTPYPAAEGAVVRASPGGSVLRVGEAGHDEAIVPLSGPNMPKGMGNTTIQLTVNAGLGTNGAQVGRQIVDVLEAHYRNGGRPPRSG
jgi:hypothetical protein